MDTRSVIWESGDPWVDLAPVVAEHDYFTVISRSGSARLFDLAVGRHNRVAVEGGHRMLFDLAWRPLDVGPGPRGWAISITPCGLTLTGAFDWAAGTALWAVLDGIWAPTPDHPHAPSWTTTPIGRSILDAISRGERPSFTTGHPETNCGAAYCKVGDV